MKKITLLGLLTMICLSLMAQEFKYSTASFPETNCDLTISKATPGKAAVRSGDVSIMRNESLSSQLILDHSNCKIEGKPTLEYLQSRGKSWVEDWPKESSEVAEHFAIQLNTRMKSPEMKFSSKEEPGQTHIMVVHVTEMDLGSFAEGAFSLSLNLKKGGAVASCVIEFINKNTGNVDCVIEVKDVKGLHQDTEERRRKTCIDSIIGQILKLSKK